MTLAQVTLVGGDTEIPLGRVVGRVPDLGVVDALARLQVAARRDGWCIRLHAVCPQLADLVDMAGLGDAIVARADSGLEARRQAEAGDQLHVEEGKEVVDGRDLSA